MKAVILLLLSTTLALANDERCYSLYMNQTNDPSKACFELNTQTGVLERVNIYTIDGHLQESFGLEAKEHTVAYRGHLALHYFQLTGVGRYHKVLASQNYGASGLMSLELISTEDGHSQRAVEFSPRPSQPSGCRPGRRCI